MNSQNKIESISDNGYVINKFGHLTIESMSDLKDTKIIGISSELGDDGFIQMFKINVSYALKEE